MNWTEQEYADFLAKTGKSNLNKPPKRGNKYHAHKTWVDGICFDSRKEAEYYARLKLLNRAEAIAGFLYHGAIVVSEGSGADSRATLYYPDFVILKNDGCYDLIDTKGVKTDVFKLKIKAIKSRYPKIEIKTE